MPTFDVGERHEVAMPSPPERALLRALAAPAAPDRFVRLLFRVRGLDPNGSIEEFLTANRFTVLERTATAYVVGLIPRRRRRIHTPDEWRSAAATRSVKIAADFRSEPRAHGSVLITETRVAAGDAAGLFAFRLYWLLIGPFSKLIRRRWLRAAVAAKGD